MKHAFVLSLLVTVSAFAQRVTPEHVLSGDVTNTGGMRTLPAAVWTGSSWAVFFNDDRGLMAGSVGLDGQLRGPVWLLAKDEFVGGIASSGEEVALVTVALPQKKIMLRRFTKTFSQIGNETILGDGQSPGVVWNGTGFFAYWLTSDLQSSIVVAKLDGGDVASSRVVNTTPGARPYRVSLAATQFDIVVVWEDLYGCPIPSIFPCISLSRLRATRLDSQLALLDTVPLEVAPDGFYPKVVTNGHDYLVVWSDLLALRAQRMHPSGALLGSPLRVDPLTNGTNSGASVAFDGREYLAVTQDFASGEAGVFGTRIDASGAIAGSPVIPIHVQSTFYEGPITFAGPPSQFLVAYHRYEQRVFRTFLRVVDVGTTPPPVRRRSSRS